MERVQIELIRKAPITKRFATMQAWSQFLIVANKQRIHKDHPDASEEEVALIFVARNYGEESLNGTTLTYMVMPFRQEGSLTDWLRKTDGSRLLTIQNVAFLIHQAASALQYAHDNQIIHRSSRN